MNRNEKGQFVKGHKGYNEGMPRTLEVIEKIRNGNLGKKRSFETRQKIKEAKMGKPSPMKGKRMSEEARIKISKSRTGKKLSEETKKRMSLAQGGTGIPVMPTKRYYHLRDKKYFEWRTKVFERDNWTCQTCWRRGCYLEPHHIKGWTKYPKLRYEVENGVTLCGECHILTRKKH